jgi:5-methylthioadenosine/S-adenosylhomocysteine deaminase
MALVLTGGTVMTMNAANDVVAAADLRIEGGAIAAISGGGAGAAPGDEAIDCRDTLIVPGFVNVHTHCAAWLFRGLVEDAPRERWAGSYAVPGQERFTAEDYAAGARAGAAEMLLNGITCIADRFAHMGRIGAALEESGIRAVLGPTISDDKAAPDWRAAEAVLERWGTSPTNRVSAGIAPHALDTCSDALLKECVARAEKLGGRLFVHAAQSAAEVEKVKARGHAGALACMMANGLVGPHIVAAHCLYLVPEELKALPETRISIAHCPVSNLKIEARTLPIARLLGRGNAIGLGTDWAVSDNAMDMLFEARLAALVGKQLADDPTALPVATMLRMMTIEGARVLGLDTVVGSIETGKRADLVVLGLQQLAANPRHDLAANLLYAMDARSVRDVLVDGEILVRGGRLTHFDEAELAATAARRGGLLRAE